MHMHMYAGVATNIRALMITNIYVHVLIQQLAAAACMLSNIYSHYIAASNHVITSHAVV